MGLRGITLITGQSGTGKTAVADALASLDPVFGVFHGGTRLRQYAAQNPSSAIARDLRTGRPVDVDAYLAMVREAAPQFDGRYLVFDGYPRSVEQAEAVPALAVSAGLSSESEIVVVELRVSESIAQRRLATRHECPSCGEVSAEAFNCPRCEVPSVARHRSVPDAAELRAIEGIRQALKPRYDYHVIQADNSPERLADQLRGLHKSSWSTLSAEGEGRDIVAHHLDCITESFRLHGVRRFFHQRFFEVETRDAEYAAKLEPYPRLETVSEHSWHLADAVLIVGPSFPSIDLARAVQLAVVHDKLEMYIGDIDPIGRDGTGRKSHAFNRVAKDRKRARERAALAEYLSKLPADAARVQRKLHDEALKCETKEARFVKSLDKLVAIEFIHVRKRGDYSDRHLELIHNLTSRNARLFDDLSAHHWMVFHRIIRSAARSRGLTEADLSARFSTTQLSLFDDDEVE